ncbi:transcription antitermination factor NusB [candidate division WOR-3 bacterium]|nr:transcription antitermination factor NusB [candidate division WOR-3 bacterium]
MTQRRLAREAALEVLYRLDLVGDEPEDTVDDILQRRNPSDEAESYLRRLVESALGHQDEIDRTLVRHLRRWRLARLRYLDRAILRLACAELLFFDDVPPKVSINEAVDVARKFGDDESGKFVNGVLDGVFRELQEEKAPGPEAD